MKRMLSLKSLLFFVPMFVFFCNYDGELCFGINSANPDTIGENSREFAIGEGCGEFFDNIN